MYASSGQIQTDASYNIGTSDLYRNGFFILPYYTRVNADNLGYDANITGVQMGYEYSIMQNMTLGIFAGYGSANVDFTGDYSRNYEDQDIFNVGLYGIYKPSNYYLTALASYNRVNQRYTGVTGTNLNIGEKDDYHSNVFESRLSGGYIFNLNNNINITPSAGIRYTSWHTPSHTTTATDSTWNTHYGSYDKDILTGIAQLNINKGWNVKGTKIVVYGGLGVQQALNNNDVSIDQSIPGINATISNVTQKITNTAGTGRLGFNIIKGKANLNFTFTSMFNGDYKTYTGYANFGVRF